MEANEWNEFKAGLKDIAMDTETFEVPNRVKKYTHDINGKALPCDFIQLNERLVHHLNKIPKHIEAKNDYFGLCFGYPGAGKTHLLERICLYLNADFSLKDISFTTDQLDDWISNAKPGDVGLFDESDTIASGYYDDVLQKLIQNSKRIRTKRLVLFFCTPTMKDMHNYFAFRAKMVLYSYIPKSTHPSNRGYFHCWHDQDLISYLFARMKKAYSETSTVYDRSYSTLRAHYIGRDVPDNWPIKDVEYEAKKEAARKELQDTAGLTPKKAVRKYKVRIVPKIEQARLKLKAGEKLPTSREVWANWLDIEPETFRRLLKEEALA